MATLLATNTENGTASGHVDLLDKLRVFANSTGWTTRHNALDGNGESELILESPDGTLCTFKTMAGYFNILLNSITAYDSALSFENQSGKAINVSYLTLSSELIEYWFNTANNKIIIVAKVGATYVSAYVGKYLPFDPPSQNPMPHFVGGNMCYNNQSITSTRTENQNWIFGYGYASNTSYPSHYYRDASLNLFRIGISTNGDWDKYNSIFGFGHYYNTGLNSCSDSLFGEICLAQPIIMQNTEAQESAIPVGTFYNATICFGEQLYPEDTFTKNGKNFIVFPNVFRSENKDFFAMEIA